MLELRGEAQTTQSSGSVRASHRAVSEGPGFLRNRPNNEAIDRLRVDVILLLPTASALCCMVVPMRRHQLPLRALVREAEDAAQRIGKPGLLAKAKVLEGKTRVIINGLREAIAEVDEAVRLARQAGDVHTEFLALIELGHHTVGRNLSRGLALLGRRTSCSSRTKRCFDRKTTANSSVSICPCWKERSDR
jgi:hypothetical protein